MTEARIDPVATTLLASRTFTPLHDAGWLEERDAGLGARLQGLGARTREILLLNATKGSQLYPSVVDFFATVARTNPGVRVTSASYFDDIHELGRGVASKGLRVVPVSHVLRASRHELDRYDAVVGFGPSEAFARLMSLPGLRSELTLVDFGFYHQLIDWTRGAFLTRGHVDPRRGDQKNPVVFYSCQPEGKLRADVEGLFSLGLFDFRWFSYIPVGFRYGAYYAADAWPFDVALLGRAGREYQQIDPTAMRGFRFLALGFPADSPELAWLRRSVDVTAVSRVDEDVYARLLALCRTVLVPLGKRKNNVLCSVVDAFASGKPLCATRREGLARLEQERAPLLLFDRPSELSVMLPALLRDAQRVHSTGERALAFAREHLDVYWVLERIARERLLGE